MQGPPEEYVPVTFKLELGIYERDGQHFVWARLAGGPMKGIGPYTSAGEARAAIPALKAKLKEAFLEWIASKPDLTNAHVTEIHAVQ